MTLGGQGRHIRELEDRITAVEITLGNGDPSPRKAAFSDEQTKRLTEHVAQALVAFLTSDALIGRINIGIENNRGRRSTGLVLWMAGAFAGGAISVIVAVLVGWIKVR